MNMQEIDEEIAKLEKGDTTWKSCEKLNILYGVKRGIQPDQETIQERAYSGKNESEFVEAFKSIPINEALAVIDEHMECIKEIFPKEYRNIIKRLKEK